MQAGPAERAVPAVRPFGEAAPCLLAGGHDAVIAPDGDAEPLEARTDDGRAARRIGQEGDPLACRPETAQRVPPAGEHPAAWPHPAPPVTDDTPTNVPALP